MSLQILHCSDVHLDRNFNISDMAKAQERKQDIEKNFTKAVNYALGNKPDVFLITGDLFERVSPSNSARVFVTETVKLLKEAGIRVFIIGGNHDVPKFGNQPLAIDVLGSAGLASVFSKSDVIQKQTIEIDGKKLCIAGKSYFSQFESENPLRGVKIPIEGDYNILMLHGSLQGLNVVSSIPEMAFQNPFHPSDLTPGLNYLALGHFHNHFEREHDGCRIVNPGSVERLSWGELNDEKGFVWAEINGSHVSTEFIKLETRKMEEFTLDLSGSSENSQPLNNQLTEYLRAKIRPRRDCSIEFEGADYSRAVSTNQTESGLRSN